MAIEIQETSQRGTASNEIQGFKASYNYEYVKGQKPSLITARLTKADSNTVIDITFNSNAIHSVVHYPQGDEDFSILNEVRADIESILNSL